MASNARVAFNTNAADVKRLIQIHADVGGDAQGRRYGLEVLNKSAIVLITAIWEAYCEDIAGEAVAHLVNHVPNATNLPKELLKKVAAEIKTNNNQLAAWDLAGDGWKVVVKARLATLTAERNSRLNTPKTVQLNDLFANAIGLPRVSDAWKWNKMSAASAEQKLDKYISLRGEIAHRGAAAVGVKKSQVLDFFNHVEQLVSKTGGAVNKHVRLATGKPLW